MEAEVSDMGECARRILADSEMVFLACIDKSTILSESNPGVAESQGQMMLF